MSSATIRHIVELELEALRVLEVHVDESLKPLLDSYEKKGHLTLDDLTKGVNSHYELVSNEIEKPLQLYFKGLIDSSRDHAYKKIGFEREARKKLLRKAAISPSDKTYEDAVERAFTKVRTIGKKVVEDLKTRWIKQNGPTDVVTSFLLDKDEKLREKNLTRHELSEKLRQLWIKKRYILQRIIRNESVNINGTVQLQCWWEQGIKKVERWEINDLRTCSLCRTLIGRIYAIEDLLNLEYPVSDDTHILCRGSFRPVVNNAVFGEFAEEFQNAGDIEVGSSKAENVPIEYQEQVEKALEDFGPDYGIKFVPDITGSKEWQSDRLEHWKNFYGEREARAKVQLEKRELSGKLVQYTADDGTVLVSGNAGSVNKIVVPILRDKAKEVYNLMSSSDRTWIVDRYNRRKKETTMTLEVEGVEIIGATPFITELAGQSAEDYFVECYTTYVADPAKLMYLDGQVYDWLRTKLMSREYLMSGGIK